MPYRKKEYHAPPDLAFAILSYLQTYGAATTETLCKTISRNGTDLNYHYAISTIRKSINSLNTKGEIEVFEKQSKRLKRKYIYTISESGREKIEEYGKVKNIIRVMNLEEAIAVNSEGAIVEKEEDKDQPKQELALEAENQKLQGQTLSHEGSIPKELIDYLLSNSEEEAEPLKNNERTQAKRDRLWLDANQQEEDLRIKMLKGM